MGDGGERGYEKVLEASGAPVHVWVRAGLSVHRASRQAILYLNGCPAQRPVSSQLIMVLDALQILQSFYLNDLFP